MPDAYTVRLTARQEGLEYRTDSAVHRVDVLLVDGEWRPYLPGSSLKGALRTAIPACPHTSCA